MTSRRSGQKEERGEELDGVFEPALIEFDRRVLKQLDQWYERRDCRAEPLRWKTAWQVAEALLEEDVAFVRQTLEGLDRFGYVSTRWNGSRRRARTWVATPWFREMKDRRPGQKEER